MTIRFMLPAVILSLPLAVLPHPATAQEYGCCCDPSANQVLLYDDFGNRVYVTSYMPRIDPANYQLDFDAIDMNSDGAISRHEAHLAADRSRAGYNLSLEFDAVDVNADGWLVREEMSNW